MTSEELWQQFCIDKGIAPSTPYQVWCFGGAPDRLAALVALGRKSATASGYDFYALDPNEPMPRVGDYSVITNEKEQAICVIRTSRLYVEAFDAVPEKQAFKEGEGDRSLAYWRKVHEEFFRAECEEFSKTFTGKKDEMLSDTGAETQMSVTVAGAETQTPETDEAAETQTPETTEEIRNPAVPPINLIFFSGDFKVLCEEFECLYSLFSIHPTTEEEARSFCDWKYPDEYAVYDFPCYEECQRAGWSLTNASLRENSYFTFCRRDETIGFFHIMDRGDHIELGVGMKPELCGQGLGSIFMSFAIAKSEELYNTLPIQLYVRPFNKRAIRCYENAGFQITDRPMMGKHPIPEDMVTMIYTFD